MVGRLDCRVDVDCGSGESVDTVAIVAAEGAVAVLFISCVCVLVVDTFVASVVSGPQLTSNKIIINPVKYGLIERNRLGSVLEL